MDVLVADFAGAEREFRLRTGEYIDLQEACGASVGVIFQRLAASTFYAQDIKNVLTYGLVGGGMKVSKAKRLVDEQMNARPLMVLAGLASDVFIQAMTGITPDETSAPVDVEQLIDKGALFHSLIQVGIEPQKVREMAYADFVAMMRAAGGKNVQPPSEDEFAEMLREWESRQEG